MDLDHWYRCHVCGHMYTPQQVQALVHLMESRAGGAPEGGPGSAVAMELTEPIPCRILGCHGTIRQTSSNYRVPR